MPTEEHRQRVDRMAATPLPDRITDILDRTTLTLADYAGQMTLEPPNSKRMTAYRLTERAQAILTRAGEAIRTPGSEPQPIELLLAIRCSDCRFFNEEPNWQVEAALARQPRTGRCTLATSDSGDPEHPESLAHAVDQEEYYASLLVSPDFGCVQGQPRQGSEEHAGT